MADMTMAFVRSGQRTLHATCGFWLLDLRSKLFLQHHGHESIPTAGQGFGARRKASRAYRHAASY